MSLEGAGIDDLDFNAVDDDYSYWSTILFGTDLKQPALHHEVQTDSDPIPEKQTIAPQGEKRKRKAKEKVQVSVFELNPNDKRSDQDITLSKIIALKAEIAALNEKRNAIKKAGTRAERNILSATLSRRKTELLNLEKQHTIYKLQAEDEGLRSENTALQTENAELKIENAFLRAELEKLKRFYAGGEQQVSFTLPQTSMLINFKSPTVSPRKPPIPEMQIMPGIIQKNRFSGL